MLTIKKYNGKIQVNHQKLLFKNGFGFQDHKYFDDASPLFLNKFEIKYLIRNLKQVEKCETTDQNLENLDDISSVYIDPTIDTSDPLSDHFYFFREKLWFPRNGANFGCDFLLYKTGSPDDSHSQFMFSITTSTEEILRLLRIAISVHKKLIIFNGKQYQIVSHWNSD